jgi:hypothetical protein
MFSVLSFSVANLAQGCGRSALDFHLDVLRGRGQGCPARARFREIGKLEAQISGI